MVAAFAYFVWPTPWKYPDDGRYARRHRVAPRYEILIDLGDGTTGWATHVVDEDTGVRTLLDPDVGGP